MSDKMLVTQALDERDLLVKKITDKIEKASFIDTIKPNEERVYVERCTIFGGSFNFKREDCEHGINEVFINYANERHPYAVAIKTSTNNVKVFESSELSPIDKEFIVDDAIVVGYEEILEKQFPIVKWKDLVVQYPEKWILYANSIKDSESGDTLYTLIDVCAESEVDDHMMSLMDKEYPVAALKVTSTMVGVMV